MDPLANLAFTTSGALIETVDKKVLVHLRDGRKLVGVLRSYDQYANLVLTQTVERLFHLPTQTWGQIDRGVFLVRGENVVLLGEIDLNVEDEPLEKLKRVPWPEIVAITEKETKEKESQRNKELAELKIKKGFSEEGGEGDAY